MRIISAKTLKKIDLCIFSLIWNYGQKVLKETANQQHCNALFSGTKIFENAELGSFLLKVFFKESCSASTYCGKNKVNKWQDGRSLNSFVHK